MEMFGFIVFFLILTYATVVWGLMLYLTHALAGLVLRDIIVLLVGAGVLGYGWFWLFTHLPFKIVMVSPG